MENRPVDMPAQQTVDACPGARFAVLSQNEDGEISRLCQIPAAIGTTGKAQKTVEEVVAGIRVGFDVVEQHARGIAQFRTSRGNVQMLHSAITLDPGLGHQAMGSLPVLLSEPCHALRQLLGIRCRQVLQTFDTQLLQHLPAFRPDATHLTEMPFLRSDRSAGASPAAEAALAPVRCQGRWGVAAEVLRQLAQTLGQLPPQAG